MIQVGALFQRSRCRSDDREILQEEAFKRMISVERKRTERSKKPFLLMLLETGGYHAPEKNANVLANILSALLASTRETDVIGWYKNQSTVGVVFTELVIVDKNSILGTMLKRVSGILQDVLTFEQFNQISISFHFFPDEWDHEIPQRSEQSDAVSGFVENARMPPDFLP